MTIRNFLVLLILHSLLGCKTDKNQDFTLFRLLNTKQTHITFNNQLQENPNFNIIQYLYYYNGGGVAAGDINNDGLTDLFFTSNEGENQLYLNLGNLEFKNITAEVGIVSNKEWSNGVAMADVNGDGWLDIYVCQLGQYKGKNGHNLLYINNGIASDGKNLATFTESATAYGLDFKGFSTHATFFDYDLDGDLDAYLLNHAIHAADNYTNATTTRAKRNQLSGDRLMRNDGNHFTDVTALSNIYSSPVGFGLGVAVSDVNNDGFPDIYVSNDFHENDYLYLNNGDGTFTEGIEKAITHTSQFSMGNNIADINNDGWTDIVTLDMKPDRETTLKQSVGADPYNIFLYKKSYGYHYQFPRNMLQLNNADGTFSEIGQLAGIAATDWSWSALLEDMDNDGWKDIFITNGILRRPNDLDYLKYVSNQQVQKSATDAELIAKMPSGKVSNVAFRNIRNLQFENRTNTWGLEHIGASQGATFADLDNDGDKDLIINNLNEPVHIYENTLSDGSQFLKIKLKGLSSNSFGVGAKVTLYIENQQLFQELYPNSGFLSSKEPYLLFGTGMATLIDSIKVVWATGETSKLSKVATNQQITIQQTKYNQYAEDVKKNPPHYWKISTNTRGLDFLHRENAYNDFESERLMPYLLSRLGPKIAIGDVDSNGWDDIFLGGANGQKSALFLQNEKGAFKMAPQYFKIHPESEVTDAIFFDSDQDGDLDLYIVTGSNMPQSLDPNALDDQLYLNNGKGQFALSPNKLPHSPSNGAAAVALDFNTDGAMDIFVASRSVVGSYGLSPKSYLLQNLGEGKFSDVTEKHLPNTGHLGMLTDIAVLQENNQPYLVLVGDWMPVTMLHPENGIWRLQALPDTEGLWNTIALEDLNQDGKTDMVLGNFGWNSPLVASPTAPMHLYVDDLDKNGKTDPIITYNKQSQEFPIASIDELIAQLPILKKQLTSYTALAKQDFTTTFRVFPLPTPKKVTQLASSLLWNLGANQYTLSPLPLEAQISPVFAIAVKDINKDGKKDIFLGGNLSSIRPDLGSCMASKGIWLLNDGAKSFTATKLAETIEGEVRDATFIQQPQGLRLLLARNNTTLLMMEQVEQ